MNIINFNLPNIKNYMSIILQKQIDNDVTLLFVFKTIYRSDNVLIDIYLDDISDNTKIISGRVLQPNSIVCLPRNDINFNYKIECVDSDGIHESINKNNLHKFYLQLTTDTSTKWDIE